MESISLVRIANIHKRYQLICEVGAGTYGVVYKAKSSEDGKFYAMKKNRNWKNRERR
jgi:hypothetical protein